MDKYDESERISARQRMRQSQKAWKFIRDVNNTSLSDLNRTAITDGKREYTYGLMFREWERYASVFSALGMTGESRSRVGILGSTSAEVVFSFYGLNMTGAEVSIVTAYSSFTPKRVIQTIRSERLTDFILTDDFAQANLINELLVRQKELGLKNIIVLHIPVTGVTVSPVQTAVQEAKYGQLSCLYGPIYMDNLLASYGSCPVRYASEESNDAALILHTTGTTSGTGKPVPLSDRALNAAAACFYKKKDLELPWDNLVTAAIVDLSNAYSMIDQVHVPFAMGAEVVMVPGGILNPSFYKAIPEYGISFLFTVSAMFERWLKMPERKRFDFSSLRFAVLGGASVSAADKRRFYEFLKKNGAGDVKLLNGYGISEMGGACCLSTADIDDEAIGYPLPGVSIRLFDEDSGKYLSVKDAPCEGVMYLNSTSEATAELDGAKAFKIENIDNRPYVCTNDLVRMDTDGRITFLGRANRYFINEEGRKYESGRVETEFSRQSGIESCGIVPVYVKTIHDNMPMLVAKTLDGAGSPKDVMLKALRKVFTVEKTLSPDDIPFRIMISADLPRNANGKIDLYRINRGEVEGDIYTVETVRTLGRLTDFRLTPYKEGPADMIKEVFDGISADMKRDIKSNLPFNKSNKNNDEYEEANKMADTKKALESFNAMNRIGRQMMKNMMSQMARGNSGCQFPGMPDMSKMMPGMPDMQKMMAGIQQMNQKMMPGMQNMQKMMAGMQQMNHNMMAGMQQMDKKMQGGMEQLNQKAVENIQQMNQKAAENMQQINRKFAESMPGVQDMMQNQAAAMIPQMQKQMNEMVTCMQQMNQTALDLMQKMFDQNVKMMNQFFEAAKSQTAPAEKKAGEDEAAEVAEKPVKEAKPAKPAKAAKAAPAEKKAETSAAEAKPTKAAKAEKAEKAVEK